MERPWNLETKKVVAISRFEENIILLADYEICRIKSISIRYILKYISVNFYQIYSISTYFVIWWMHPFELMYLWGIENYEKLKK